MYSRILPTNGVTIPPNLTGKVLKVVTKDFSEGSNCKCDLSNYVDKRIDNSISGNIEIYNANLSVTNGTIIGGVNSLATGENSFAYGNSVSAIGKNSYATGISSVAGCYGWYYTKLDTDAKCFYISATQPQQLTTPRGPADVNMSFNSGLAVGDVISFANFNKYDIGSTIVAISGNVISVNQFPAGGGDTRSIESLRLTPDHDDWSIFCPAKPLAGKIWFGEASYAEGENTKAINAYSHAEGKDNIAYGQFSHVEGRNNEVGYASHAEGRGVRVNGQYSHGEGLSTEVALGVNTCAHVEGRETKALDRYSHAEGYLTQAKLGCHAEGLSAKAHGNYSHAEGEGTYAFGQYSHTEGYQTQAQNQSEHAQGQFNKSNRGTLHSIGFGTSDSNRKNAIEVMQNGDVYVYNVGNYLGNNFSAAQTLQTAISNFATKAYVNGKYDEANSWWTGFINGGFEALKQAHFTDNTYALPEPNAFASNPALMAATIYAIATSIVIAAKPSTNA